MHSFQSIELISRALVSMGYTFEKVRKDGHGHRIFKKGAKTWSTSYQYVQYPFISPELKAMAVNKKQAYDFVSSHGFTIPKTHLFSVHIPFDAKLVADFRYPLIVKPVDGSGSMHVTRNIRTEQELELAVKAVHEQGSDALAQEQFVGQELRLTVIENEVVSACLRDTPRLVGDGTSTYVELLATENAAREQLRLPYMEYPLLTDKLVNLPPDLDVVPLKGEIWPLSPSTMISGGASVYSITETLHPSYKELARTLVQELKAPFLVVDVLVTDYTQPATPESYVFLEFNTSPALKLYYSFREGDSYDIVSRLATMIDKHLA